MTNQNVKGLPAKAGAHNGTKKFGRNAAGSTSIEDVWNLGGQKTWGAAAATIYISSTNQANDNDIYITVEYIDANGLEATVTGQLHATDARTFVSLGVTALDVNRAYLSGDNEALTGTVYISNDNTDVGGNGIPDTIGNALATIPPADGQTMQALYYVPANRTAFLTGWMFTTNAATATHSVICRLQVKPAGGSWRTVEAAGAELGRNWSSNWDFAEEVPASSAIRITCIGTAACDVSASFSLYKEVV
jgi:hypothetical protein